MRLLIRDLCRQPVEVGAQLLTIGLDAFLRRRPRLLADSCGTAR